MAVAEFRGRAMACELQVIAVDPVAGQLDRIAAHIGRLEALWSRFVPTSDISRINASPGYPVAVAPETVGLVEKMLEAWRLTEGRFDPTVLPALMAIGYDVSRSDPGHRTVLAAGEYRLGAMGEVTVDRQYGTVRVPTGVAIDPGGIGKGLAADLGVAAALADGAAGCLIGIGGDLAMGGTAPDPSGWLIRVEQADPEDGVLCTLAVSNGGVATSSTRSRRWMQRGESRHHLIDPGSGEPSPTDLAAVTVFAASGWQAEAFATGAMLGGGDEVVGYLRRNDLTGVAISESGAVLASDDLAAVEFTLPVGVR